MWDAILDAFLDTLKIFPFIFVIYVLIELLEHKTSFTRDRERLQGGLAPLIGAATGIIPQCGFSVMAAKLYDRGLIRTGTLLAVFLATSDEALIILLSEGSRADMIVPIIVIKLIVAVGVGYGANFLLADEKLAVMPLSVEDDVHCFSCGREHDGKTDIKVYLVDPLLHSLKIALYLLIVNMVLGCIIYEIGEDANLFADNRRPLPSTLHYGGDRPHTQLRFKRNYHADLHRRVYDVRQLCGGAVRKCRPRLRRAFKKRQKVEAQPDSDCRHLSYKRARRHIHQQHSPAYKLTAKKVKIRSKKRAFFAVNI